MPRIAMEHIEYELNVPPQGANGDKMFFVQIDAEKCIGCDTCQEYCPTGAIVGETGVKAEFVNNSKSDTYKVEIRKNKDNTLIADAFELAAGKSISALTLLEAPEFGNVDCTVTITSYRDGKQIGSLQTELVLHTAYLWPKEVQ